MDPEERTSRVHHELAAVLDGSGVMVESVAIHPAGKRRLMRVTVDRDLSTLPTDDHTSAVEPLTLDEIAEATRAVSAHLDDSDVMGTGPYVLELTSFGVDRPLTQPRHFRRNVTRLLRLTPTEGEQVVGRVRVAGPQEVTLAVDDGSERTIGYADIARAQVEVEFTRRTEGEDR